jgi:hypothetical protein
MKRKKKAKGNQLLSVQKAIINAVVIGSSKVVDKTMSREEAMKNIKERLGEVKMKYGLPACLNIIPFLVQKMEKQPIVTFHMRVKNNGQLRDVDVQGRILYEALREYHRENTVGSPRQEIIEESPS